MESLSGNSHKSREEKTPAKIDRAEKVVTGEVQLRKRSVRRRLAESLMPGKPDEIVDYVLWDVFVPNARDAVMDAALSFVERIFTGSDGGTKRRRRVAGTVVGGMPGGGAYSGVPGSGPYVDYSGGSNTHIRMSSAGRKQHNFDEIQFDTRAEAEKVLSVMEERILKYKSVTVADLYDLLGLPGDFTDDKWGWFDLSEANATRHRGKHILDLPPTQLLD